MARHHDDDLDEWEDSEDKPPAPNSEFDAEAVSEVDPHVRFVVKPMDRVPPFLPRLKRVLLRHRLLFHFYARPVYRSTDNIDQLGQYFFAGYCAGSIVPKDRDADQVGLYEGAIEDEINVIARVSVPDPPLSGYNTGTPPPIAPAHRGLGYSVGWLIHPVGIEVLKSNAKEIETLVDLLLTYGPVPAEKRVLDNTRFLARPRLMPIFGGRVVWSYPDDVRLAAEGLGCIEALEARATNAGWRPPTQVLHAPTPLVANKETPVIDDKPDARGEVNSPSDPSAYVEAKVILSDHNDPLVVKSHKELVEKVLANHPEIRRWHPRSNRLNVHLVDWLRYAKSARTHDQTEEDSWPDHAEIEKRKAEMRRIKHGK